MSEVNTRNRQPESSAREMQSVTSHRYPFNDVHMNFWFAYILGMMAYGGSSLGDC